MSFIQEKTFAVTKTLEGAHYDFERAKVLRSGMEWMITDYAAKSSNGKPFEAKGLIVTGPSRIGKSGEIGKMLEAVNDGSTIMPDGRPAMIEKVTLDGSLSFKELGRRTLKDGLGYGKTGSDKISSRANQSDVWDKVFFQAKEQGVVGIHFDECQHIFSGKSASVRKIILDSFKSLLKRTDWPLMLILSGVNELTEYVSEEEQLSYLLRPVVFTEIRPNNTVDLKEISDLCHLYAGKVGIDFPENLWTSDFTKRLAFCSANRWGLLIELVIDALKIAHFNDVAQVDTEHFCKSFTDRTGFAVGHSPISIEYYEEAFDTQKILDMVRRSEVAGKSEDRKRRPK
ncbi:hypothetical protein [Sulfitobacter donghicola]|uniref:Transposase n=1 Tax=Sulfitobacter donghicola DSW-25 = KCTC 12864 = JCM 14565 TaxID=1300350 RepID=A0A073IEW9_9RHOB|nr:hypothetical protein [Sulfitobacter donghicola]KEJ88913.1 transposase [Sulfitobacter donghicola DSW-25 = KCTC 12864 = JCM 14565]KIN67543.1 putative transposition protein [Sulfitobacter donghicola DSW-25 = KCTC 12864 = JCM 14565]